jgi:aminoglycoside phosphotransferase
MNCCWVSLTHESPHIVNWAGDALGKFENVEALPAMVAASERIGGEQMIEAAIRRLRGLEKQGVVHCPLTRPCFREPVCR